MEVEAVLVLLIEVLFRVFAGCRVGLVLPSEYGFGTRARVRRCTGLLKPLQIFALGCAATSAPAAAAAPPAAAVCAGCALSKLAGGGFAARLHISGVHDGGWRIEAHLGRRLGNASFQGTIPVAAAVVGEAVSIAIATSAAPAAFAFTAVRALGTLCARLVPGKGSLGCGGLGWAAALGARCRCLVARSPALPVGAAVIPVFRAGASATRCRGAITRVELGRVACLFHEVGDVKKRVALEPDVHKGRLHTREYARHFAVVDGAGEGVFVLALVIDFSEIVVFDDG